MDSAVFEPAKLLIIQLGLLKPMMIQLMLMKSSMPCKIHAESVIYQTGVQSVPNICG